MESLWVRLWGAGVRPVIGMLHLRALAGSPRWGGDRAAVREAVMADAEALVSGGATGLMLENFGDAPFFPGSVPVHVVAEMTELAMRVRRKFWGVPLGINVLRNDGMAALGIAAAIGAQFVRVNVLIGARVTDQGIVQGIAHDLLRLRRTLGVEDVAIFGDVEVKHSAALAERNVKEETADLVERGGADAVIVSGSATGKVTPVERVRAVKAWSRGRAVVVGSGVEPSNVRAYLDLADGFIVGSWVKREGKVEEPVDAERVRRVVEAVAAS